MQDGERRNWRQHPLAKRLPILMLVAMGLWLWKGSDVPERELVWRLVGPGWSEIRTVEFQVKNADGELVKRQVHSFQRGAPDSVTEKTALPSGVYEVWVFARGESGPSRPPRVERLTVGDEDVRIERGLRVPEGR
ncbi:hypothetical protein [Archangium lipolyticum]|uniref:hypothetical protein n=1 Tax=Archangium lipolyticum TaxID=2970465 RepID=UPI002149A350|nr:hypothetical protein [Archangium lipolyticum]